MADRAPGRGTSERARPADALGPAPVRGRFRPCTTTTATSTSRSRRGTTSQLGRCSTRPSSTRRSGSSSSTSGPEREPVPAEVGRDDAPSSQVRPDELPVGERAAAAVQQDDVWSVAAVVDDSHGAVRRGDAVFGHAEQANVTLRCPSVRGCPLSYSSSRGRPIARCCARAPGLASRGTGERRPDTAPRCAEAPRTPPGIGRERRGA